MHKNTTNTKSEKREQIKKNNRKMRISGKLVKDLLQHMENPISYKKIIKKKRKGSRK